MNSKLIILATALAVSATGCEPKTELTTPSSVNSKTSPQKIPETIGQRNEMRNEVAKALPKTAEMSEKKSATDVKETTEQSLAEISKRSREVTKTQESKSRNRAQNAEEEMLKDLEKSK